MKKHVFAMLLCAAAVMQPAFAQEAATTAAAEPAASTTTMSAPASAATAMPAPAVTAMPAPAVTTPAPATASATKSVPKLVITWDCGECEHNDKVIPLIEAAYAEQARSQGVAVSETDTAEAAITDIRQRPPGVRVMFGIMAGKDRLGMRIRYRGNEFTVSDYSANAITGLNHLSASVAKRAYVRLLLSPPATTAAATPTE